MPGTTTPNQSQSPVFQAFSWHSPGIFPDQRVILTEYARNIGAGIGTLLELIEFSDTQMAFDGRPLLGDQDKSSLMRLAITSGKLLADYAHAQISHANRTHADSDAKTSAGGAK
ncbi:hypothetical protein [Herbaspirillum frisingense]|uniref:hypothetical protein n=1 Tax=Herbaspirillum frisingense TaxID=92645 RepID=UPI001F2AE956|nr:hypothetical protein [Herbaspirillum frisingense]UIN23506.1 hypothetical protein LAZ82_10590 [Herbaspirillum frisingense]